MPHKTLLHGTSVDGAQCMASQNHIPGPVGAAICPSERCVFIFVSLSLRIVFRLRLLFQSVQFFRGYHASSTERIQMHWSKPQQILNKFTVCFRSMIQFVQIQKFIDANYTPHQPLCRIIENPSIQTRYFCSSPA